MSSPKVSICIPTYKQTKYLRKTLNSILIQNYNDYEIIITDDSPDDSVQKLVDEYNFNGKLKYFKNKETKGSPENWNEAIRRASGEYIKILHHDDWFTNEDSLREYTKMLDNNPQSDFAFSSTVVQYADSNKTKIHKITKDQKALLKLEPCRLFLGNIIGAPSATIYRKKINKFYDKNLKWLVDIDFYINILLENNIFVYSDKALITTTTEAGHNITNECINNKDVEIYEHFYLFNKIKDNLPDGKKRKYFISLFRLLVKYNIKSLKEIKDCGYNNVVDKSILRFLFFYHSSPIVIKWYLKLLKKFY